MEEVVVVDEVVIILEHDKVASGHGMWVVGRFHECKNGGLAFIWGLFDFGEVLLVKALDVGSFEADRFGEGGSF